ncbi:unnamed protein product [Polarella glacialis]|uniref:Uncharacterized protein n=1 Tax=Polarella glacialis TaxID=89957 RepID=A0A813GNW4_POLGL|nr:unnamed protein product [Polarella glacialis]
MSTACGMSSGLRFASLRPSDACWLQSSEFEALLLQQLLAEPWLPAAAAETEPADRHV